MADSRSFGFGGVDTDQKAAVSVSALECVDVAWDVIDCAYFDLSRIALLLQPVLMLLNEALGTALFNQFRGPLDPC